MLGSTPLLAVLGSGVDNTDHEAVKAFGREATKLGLAVMFIRPNSKAPADPRTSRQKSAANRAAQKAAQDAGRRNWEKVKAPAGLALASSDPKIFDRYLANYLETRASDVGVNLAIEIGASRIPDAEGNPQRLIVVDCDTPEQYAKFIEVAQAATKANLEGLPPTVATPGQVTADGEWVHSEGGHFYFTVPEDVELPTSVGSLTWGGEHGFAVLWHSRYVLIPPSTRPEGSYEAIGQEYPCPRWLLETILDVGARREERRHDHRETSDDSLSEAIDAWAEATPWESMLEPEGFTPAPRPDSCGCAIWTGPGDHASPKTLTAHDSGCTSDRYTETNAPLHIWSDTIDPPFDEWVAEHGSKTLSKLQVYALIHYGGNIGKAMDALGLAPDLGIGAELGVSPANMDDGPDDTAANLDDDLGAAEPQHDVIDEVAAALLADEAEEGYDPATIVETPRDPWDTVETAGTAEKPSSDDAGPEETTSSDDADDEFTVYPDLWDSGIANVPRIAPFGHWRDMPPPEYIVEGLIEHMALSCIIGPPGVGKSSVALDIACHIATGRRWQGRRVLKTKVLYLPGEGLSGAVQRINAWEDANGVEVGEDLLLGDGIISLGATKEAWQALAAHLTRLGVGLIIFDTFARMATTIEENSATEVGKAVKRFDQLKQMTGAGVLIVHHTAKGSESGRGSSALNGALDSELLVRDHTWTWDQLGVDPANAPRGKMIELTTTKQKNAEQLADPMPLMLVSWENNDSVIVTGPTGAIDPFSGEVVLAPPTPEPLVELAVRIRRYVDRFPQQGVTRGDIIRDVRPDPYTLTRADVPKRWKARVNEAVDRAMRYQLIATLSGTPSGARYIPDLGTIEGARQQAASEVITDDVD